MHDARTGVDRLLVVQVDAVADERRLTGEVGVVGPGGGTGRDQRHAVTGVRPHGRHHHLGACGHRIERGLGGGVGGDQWPRLGAGSQTVPDRPQALLGTAGQGDSGRSPGSGQVFGGQFSGETRGAVQHQIKLTLRHHPDATRAVRAAAPAHPAGAPPGRRAPPGTRSWRVAVRAPSGSPSGNTGTGVGCLRSRRRAAASR
ncbi:hypothetical protein BN970_06507 [Mycolicibacterium conceptionense]|uniref:Uncharacterized protein n=1 Tax=Mycolicibacterium conceptionense TaxID=451644 RepID=A0A0U1DXH2_9MYCO|nr:hypothetical protein BN970_06507 [Mycolicibacterium conceptionense]